MTSPRKDNRGASSPNSDCKLWSGFERAWNAHDATGVAAGFDAGACLDFYDGRIFSGRAAIGAFYREAFASMPGDWVHTTTHITALAPELHTGSVVIKRSQDNTAIMELRFTVQQSRAGSISILSLRKSGPIVHLVHGLPGTGKSTFARRLVAQTGAVCLNHDEWMIALYGNNPPAKHFADYHDRVLNLIWKMAAEFAGRNIDVILDHGFWMRTARDQARAKAASIGASPLLYAMICPPEVADARVLRRNQYPGDTALYINQAALDLFRTRYEPLGADESHIPINSTN